jgi:cyclase
MKQNMFYKADPLLFAKAKELRNHLTASENIFWLRLKENFKGYKFRRQHPILIYVVDFYCHKLKLVIEVDGPIHDSEDAKRYDKKRQQDLEDLNLTVLRFTNEQVKNQIECVIETISSFIMNRAKRNDSSA